MDTKKYLESLRLLDARIDQRIKQLNDIGRRRLYISAELSRFDSGDPENACSGGALESDIIGDLRAEISGEILKFERQRNEIIGRIQSLNNHKFVQVLYKRYVEYKPFEQIAAELGYARSHTLLLHRNAVEAMQALVVQPNGTESRGEVLNSR